MKDGAFQVHLEIRVDGGGGEAGEEVVQLSHNWNWTHGVKVVMIIMIIVIEMVNKRYRYLTNGIGPICIIALPHGVEV